MNTFATSKIVWKIALIMTVISFIWFGTFGLLHQMNQIEPGAANMSGCLFNGQTEACNMSFPEHFATWQRMFSSLPQDIKLLSLIALALIAIAIILSGRSRLGKPPEQNVPEIEFYMRQHPEISLSTFLREAFSQGILNSKIYEPAIV